MWNWPGLCDVYTNASSRFTGRSTGATSAANSLVSQSSHFCLDKYKIILSYSDWENELLRVPAQANWRRGGQNQSHSQSSTGSQGFRLNTPPVTPAQPNPAKRKLKEESETPDSSPSKRVATLSNGVGTSRARVSKVISLSCCKNSPSHSERI